MKFFMKALLTIMALVIALRVGKRHKKDYTVTSLKRALQKNIDETAIEVTGCTSIAQEIKDLNSIYSEEKTDAEDKNQTTDSVVNDLNELR